MTINIFVNLDKLFDWTGNAEDAEGLDKALREVAHNRGVTPKQVADRVLEDVLEHGRFASGGETLLMSKLLSYPTGHPDHPGLYRDYVEALDLYFYIVRTKSKRISILKEITPKGASPIWPAMMKDRSSFLCLDCGVDTGAIDEYYMVTHELWACANPDGAGMLCIGCLEKRLGRELTPDDFPNGADRSSPKSERLLKRLGDSRKSEAKFKEAVEASKRFTETMRRELDALWARYADDLRRESMIDFGDDDFSDEIFSRMLRDLILVARAHRADNIIAVLEECATVGPITLTDDQVRRLETGDDRSIHE